MVEFYGGDLAGVEAHLDHLTDLGVNAIYLTPIFESRSNHGYDIVDYRRVADYYGGDDALASLRRATRERDILLILDIAPNHTGVEHPWFRAAQADPAAPTAGYYVFGEHPHDYESWLGVGSLPKLDYRSEALREAMYAGPDSVLRHWLRPPFSIDGWRIDVANMLGRLGPDQLGPEVARGMRAAIKAENPDAYLVGEHSFDAIDQLAGDQWDGVMNYWGFATPVVEWLEGVAIRSHSSGLILRTGRSSTEAMVQTMTAFRSAIPWSVARHQFNLLDSHDTARILSRVGGDRERLRAAVGYLLTYVGLPSILYGDEVGLDGADDLMARRTMVWDRSAWDMGHLDFVRTLVRFRVGSPALTEGGFQVLEIGQDHLAFLRDANEEWVVVVIVRGPGSRPAGPLAVWHGGIPDGTTFADLLGGTSLSVTSGALRLPAIPPGLAIWAARPGT
jgi:alpha-glucosidase